jgi:ribosomal-protein-serine acetyltransferase
MTYPSYLPDHFESERLLLRAPRHNDGALVNTGILESINELRAWMPWARETPTIAESETFAREAAMRYRTREELNYLLFRKDDGVYLGNIGLHTIAWDVPRFEIGYWLRTSLSGHGYMTEAVIALSAFAFSILGAKRIEIRCDSNNLRSARVAERAGYQLEVKMRWQSRTPMGDLRDTLVYVMFSDTQTEAITRAASALKID